MNELEIGDTVIITSGPFKDMQGTVLDILGTRTCTVEIPMGIVPMDYSSIKLIKKWFVDKDIEIGE